MKGAKVGTVTAAGIEIAIRAALKALLNDVADTSCRAVMIEVGKCEKTLNETFTPPSI